MKSGNHATNRDRQIPIIVKHFTQIVKTFYLGSLFVAFGFTCGFRYPNSVETISMSVNRQECEIFINLDERSFTTV